MYHDTGHNSCFKITEDLKEDKNNMKPSRIDRKAGIDKNAKMYWRWGDLKPPI